LVRTINEGQGEDIMTDRERVIVLLKDLNVGFEEYEETVVLEGGMEKVSGYPCFYIKFSFDRNGKFEDVGAYE